MIETIETITAWGHATFGKGPPANYIQRAAQEFSELADALVEGDLEKIKLEAADVIIVLAQLTDQATLDRKMKINREREWRITGQGTGQHL